MTSFGNVIGRHKKMAKLAYNFVRTITAKNDDKKVMGSTFNDFFEIILAVYCSEVPQLYFFYLSKIFNKTISLKMSKRCKFSKLTINNRQQVVKIELCWFAHSQKKKSIIIDTISISLVQCLKVYFSLLSEATLTHNLSHSHWHCS